MRGRRPWRTRRTGATTSMHLAVGAQHAVEAGLAGEVGALVGQGGDDARGRQVGEARLVGDGHDPRPLRRAQRVRGDGSTGTGAPIRPDPTVTTVPALHRAGIQTDQGAHGCQSRSGSPGLTDAVHQGLAILRAGHASSPSWKIAGSFFPSTARRPSRTAPCPCGAARARAHGCGAGPAGCRPRWRPAALPGRQARRASRPPGRPHAGPARGTRHCGPPHPWRPWRSPPPAGPPPSSAGCQHRAAYRRQPRVIPPATAPASAHPPTSRETTPGAALSSGSRRATTLSLNGCPYQATANVLRPRGSTILSGRQLM